MFFVFCVKKQVEYLFCSLVAFIFVLALCVCYLGVRFLHVFFFYFGTCFLERI